MDTIIDSDSVDMGSIPVRDTRKTGMKYGLFFFFQRKTHSKGCGMERSIGTGSILTAGKKYRKTYTAFLLAACFLIPAAIMLITYACYGMAPFGENSVLIMDMSNQYCEFYCGLKHIGSMGDLFFSWSKALGGNYIGVFAYYLSSPLSILTLLCPNAEMPVCLLFLTCLKIGLCGLTFGIFLNKRHKRAGCGTNRFYIVLFSVCYAMMSYNIVYSLSLMWIDAVIWLPLIILGTENLVYEGRWGLLLFSFTGIFISTYYLSYMAGIFTCIYLLYAIAGRRDLTKKGIFKILFKFAGSAGGAAALGAWLLVPTFFSLLQGKIGGDNYQNHSLTNYNLLELFKKMIIGTYDGIIIRVTPFLYCGILVFIFFFAFFFLKSVSRERKIGIAMIVSFLLLSTFILRVDWAWHIFQLPNWFPYRYTFVISFIMVLTAASACMHIQEISRVYYCVFTMLMMSVYIVFFLKPHLGITKQQIRYSVVFLILAMGLLLLLKYIPDTVRLGKRRMRTYAARGMIWLLILCMTSVELSVHADYLLHGLDNEHGFESYGEYHKYKKRMEELVKIAGQDDTNTGGSGFYRIVQGFQRNYNEGIGLGYQSISHYSSAYNRHINSFLHKLGFAQIYLWSSNSGSTLMTDALFSVKYMMTDPEIEQNDPENKIVSWNPLPLDPYDRVRKYDGTILYRNPYVLAPCYAASDRIHQFEWGEDPLESQNRLMNALTGTEQNYYIKLRRGAEYSENKTAKTTTYLITMPYSGPLYAYFPKGTSGESPPETPLRINNDYKLNLYINETDCTLFMGTYEKGEVVTITIEADSEKLKTSGNVFYVLEMQAFTAAVNNLREHQIEISDWGAGYLRGRIDTGENNIVFTGITYDKGWRVFVDGKETKADAFQDGLLYFEVAPGEHEIELRYTAEGRRAGLIISFASCAGLLLYAAVHLIRKQKRTAP